MKKLLLTLLCFFAMFSSKAQCDYTLLMIDSYGDGWNGNTMSVYVNGTVVIASETLLSGDLRIIPFTVNPDDIITSIWEGGGSYGYETSYIIKDSTGASVWDGDENDSDPITANCPSCLLPTALAVSGETTTTADLAWTAGGTETLWDIELVDVTASGSATGTPTYNDITTNSLYLNWINKC